MCDCKREWLWVRSPLEEIKYLFEFMFLFVRSGVEAKRVVEPRHSICFQNSAENAPPIDRPPLLTLLCAGYSVKLIKKVNLLLGQILMVLSFPCGYEFCLINMQISYIEIKIHAV